MQEPVAYEVELVDVVARPVVGTALPARAASSP
jgi:hypothetical protein